MAHTVFLISMAEPKLPVHNFDTGLDYATIQEAITANETLNGHTIYVDAGTYYENLIIDKSISLVGQSELNTTIMGQAPRSIIYITADNVTITGFTIKESAYGYDSVYLYNSTGNNITNNIVKNSYCGVHLYNSTDNIICDNIITECEYGILLYNSSSNDLSTNAIANNNDGIHLDISNNNHLSGNNITLSMGNGIYLFQSSNNIISASTLSQNGARGIRLHNSTDNAFSENTVSENQRGFDLYESANNTLFYNTVSNNTDGILLMHSDQNIIQANTIINNSQYGLRLLDSSYNKFFHNNFINNTLRNVEQPSSTSIANLWDDFFEGNYWSDQQGEDVNKDGIIDSPYIVDERIWLGIHSKDNYPLAGQFQYSNIQFQNQSYYLEIISNSTFTEAQYDYSQKKEATLILNFTSLQNTTFYRLAIPDILVEPPYTLSINNSPTVYNNTIRTNGTYTWTYLEYNSSGVGTTITLMHQATPIVEPTVWTQWSFWGLLGMIAFGVILSLVNIQHHQTIEKQKNLLHLYEEKLRKADPIVIARELFTADVQNRKTKITRFEEKYNMRIQPRNSFEDVIKGIKSRQKKSEETKE
jgi:parallel beta-helix repeat protein